MWIEGKAERSELTKLAHTLVNSGEEWKESIGKFISEWLNDSDFVEVKTSGSTGKPKTIQLSKKLMSKSAENTNDYFGLNDRTTALLCLSAENIGGKMMIVRALTQGWTLFCEAPSSSPNSENKSFDFAAMVPLQVEELLNKTPEKIDKIAKVIIGGAPISERLEKRLQGCRTHFFSTYGMTETASHVAIRPLNGNNRSAFFKLLSGIKANQDERGCLTLKADFFESEIITNDLVEFEDFDEFKVIGRFDNIINSGGVKILPEKVEKKLEELLDRRYYISSKSDEKLGELVVLHIESDPLDLATERLLFGEMKDVLDKYEVPKEIEYHDKFAETRTGKVKRKKA
ncbi:AMP-binding protein [Halocola ammonii]